eukprot:TRINITY_DN11179_c0_g1_i2.p1 TRINITY_DN11179_c0_g1~~TRINITY_DN11179_c0_g1_i2.p1  ORF type:complete len:203 (+),score=22.71 TRINITY_DN11179_c0_g1_i2:114-722(+)
MNNFGYGFVTCSRNEDAEAFARVFQGFQFSDIDSDKRMLVELGHTKNPMDLRSLRNARDHSGTFSGLMGCAQESFLDSAHGHSNVVFGRQSTGVDAEPYLPELEHRSIGPSWPQNSVRNSVFHHSSTPSDRQSAFAEVEAYVLASRVPCASSSRTCIANGGYESTICAVESAGLREGKMASPEGWEVPQTRLAARLPKVCSQ